ncbi:TIGR02530 family flagellar biosynthesis protein [Virgibacillus sp. W0430]|uniref:TIGR02530 family flagellar biosynthesis protein n=1 Tax=Virgibacillus sp. W0430 TaxID=3391580 RepID=UPI003F47C3C0
MPQRIHELQHYYSVPIQKRKTKQGDTNFKQVLHAAERVKVSKHAQQRIVDRDITINEQQWTLIAKKMQEAKHKGVTDALVVMKNAALLVSTKNNTVVTAMDNQESASKIYTNINGTIVINM